MHGKTTSKKSNHERGKRRTFTAEYKAEVVRLAQQPGKTPWSVAKELGLPPSAVGDWAKQAAVELRGPDRGELTSVEREALKQARRELRALREECAILRKATAIFASGGAT